MRRFFTVNKKITCVFLICFFGSLVAIFAAASAPEKTDNQVLLTTEELAKYDGLNGNKAYVAVDSVVYDVTNVKKWKKGMHNGHKAGQDLTSYIQKSPHGKAILLKMKKVGKLVPSVQKNTAIDTTKTK